MAKRGQTGMDDSAGRRRRFARSVALIVLVAVAAVALYFFFGAEMRSVASYDWETDLLRVHD